MSGSKSELTSRTEDAVPEAPVRFGPQAWMLGLLLLAVAFILTFRQGENPPTQNKELRIFRATTGMVQSGDYIVPRLNGRPHLKKPPLYYWAGAAVTQVTGWSERVACRLPSVLCALLLLVETFCFCRVVGRPRLAVPAVAVLACSYEFYSSGHGANFDMMLGAAALAAVLCFYKYQESMGTGWLLASGAATALALLAKATPAIPFVFVPVVAMLWRKGRLRLLAKPRVILVAMILPLAACLSWYGWVALHVENALEAFSSEGLVPFGKSVQGSAAHRENPGFFLYKIFKIMAPASLLVPLLVRRWVRTRCLKAESADLRWMLLGFLGVLAIMSIIPQKQEAYLVSMLPYLAILMAEMLEGDRSPLRDRYVGAVGLVGGTAMLVMAAVGAFYFGKILQNPAAAVLSAVASVAFAAALFARAARMRRVALVPVTAVCAWLFVASVYFGSIDVLDGQFKTGEIAQNPSYSEAHWKSLYAKYPMLAKIFKQSSSKRFVTDDDIEN